MEGFTWLVYQVNCHSSHLLLEQSRLQDAITDAVGRKSFDEVVRLSAELAVVSESIDSGAPVLLSGSAVVTGDHQDVEPLPVARMPKSFRLSSDAFYDDWLHRGTHGLVAGMNHYIYAMYIRPTLREQAISDGVNFIEFDNHYSKYANHVQVIPLCSFLFLLCCYSDTFGISYTYTYIYIYTYIDIHIDARIYIYVYIYIYTHIYICTHCVMLFYNAEGG